MPSNARRWLSGAPGGWFPSPSAATEYSETDEESSPREPSTMGPCRSSSRASTELGDLCPQGSGPLSSVVLSPREEPCASPRNEVASAEALPTTNAVAVAVSANDRRSDEPCTAAENQDGAAPSWHFCAQTGGCVRVQTHAATQTGPEKPPTPDREREAGRAPAPQVSVASHEPYRPVHRCPPRAVQCIDLDSSDDEEVRVLYQAPAVPNVIEIRVTPFDVVEFRRLCREYEAHTRPKVGAQIRSMTTRHDARTRHREVVRRGRAERALHRHREIQREHRRRVRNIGRLIQNDLELMPGPYQAPPLMIPAVVEIQARDLAAAPQLQIDLGELMENLPPMDHQPIVPQQIFPQALPAE
ncbi:hypothetical protein QAD02_013423 [Eretmocerus hayati]|uniref:Uncharacterized protein n=1 Tax=Eretmocerus hayati TaxID=131215 RepID=A0ACC2P484_9HYME|nr:hypothetical protein QAD02_013423 [Eretmocerus hayati]